jgi:predicted nucleic acid-binding protein
MICLDTHIVIWGVGGFDRATRGQEEMVPRAERYIRHLRMKGIKIIVPAPVLAEYLVGADARERQEGRIFEMGFQTHPFDVPAAVIAAELQRDKYLIDEVREEHGLNRDTIRTDIMIISIAIYRKAQKIITHDHALFKTLAQQQIPVGELPDITDQKPLFES